MQVISVRQKKKKIIELGKNNEIQNDFNLTNYGWRYDQTSERNYLFTRISARKTKLIAKQMKCWKSWRN